MMSGITFHGFSFLGQRGCPLDYPDFQSSFLLDNFNHMRQDSFDWHLVTRSSSYLGGQHLVSNLDLGGLACTELFVCLLCIA